MRGINIVILIGFIAFAIAIVSLALEYLQLFEIEPSVLHLSEKNLANFLYYFL